MEFRSEFRKTKVGQGASGITKADWDTYQLLLANKGKQMPTVSKMVAITKSTRREANLAVPSVKNPKKRHNPRGKEQPENQKTLAPPLANGAKEQCLLCDRTNHTTGQCRNLRDAKAYLRRSKAERRNPQKKDPEAKKERVAYFVNVEGRKLPLECETIKDESPADSEPAKPF